MEINERTADPPTERPAEDVQGETPRDSKRSKRPHLMHRIDRTANTSDAARHTKNPPPKPNQPNSVWTVLAVIAVGILVIGIVAVGFRGSLGALRDAALAAHIEPDAAALYWIGVDGLIVVAIIAALVLRHDREARTYCLAVVGGFTLASWLLNYLHGLGWFTPDLVSGVMSPLPWGVVLVIASLIIGTIFFGTHLLVYVLRHLFPGTAPDQGQRDESADAETPVTTAGSTEPQASEHLHEGVQRTAEEDIAERKTWAAVAYGLALDRGVKLPKTALAEAFGISTRQAGYVRADVELEREERARQTAEGAAVNSAPIDAPATADRSAPNGSHPAVSTPA